MSYKDVIIKQLPDFCKDDPFVNDLFNAIGITFDNILANMTEVDQQRFFDKLTVLLRDTEKLLALKPVTNLNDRQVNIQAKWLGSGKCDLALIQSVCNSWLNGEVVVSFVEGKIKLEFTGAYGVPSDLNSLENAINEIKPAHLAFYMAFKWLLIRDIHEVLTINEMQALTISQFARGSY